MDVRILAEGLSLLSLHYVKPIKLVIIRTVAARRPVPRRPYSSGKRLEISSRKRAAILAAARAQLESNGFLNLTLDALARAGGVTRQTVYNLFGTKAGLLEALFDQVALGGGMQRMRQVMQQSDAETLLEDFVEVFTNFWSRERLFVRRIHGLAAIDPEFGAAVEARNRRRLAAAGRVVERWSATHGEQDVAGRTRRIAVLCALTSFEFFDVLAENLGSPRQAALQVLILVKREFASQP